MHYIFTKWHNKKTILLIGSYTQPVVTLSVTWLNQKSPLCMVSQSAAFQLLCPCPTCQSSWFMCFISLLSDWPWQVMWWGRWSGVVSYGCHGRSRADPLSAPTEVHLGEKMHGSAFANSVGVYATITWGTDSNRDNHRPVEPHWL